MENTHVWYHSEKLHEIILSGTDFNISEVWLVILWAHMITEVVWEKNVYEYLLQSVVVGNQLLMGREGSSQNP